jgi:cell division protease FtsH
MDKEISRILGEQRDRARRVLQEHRRALDQVAGALAAHETLEGKEIEDIIAHAEDHDSSVGNGQLASA